MTFFCHAAPRFERTTGDFPSQPVPGAASQIQVMPLNSLRISLADYVQLSLQAGFIQRPAIRSHPYHRQRVTRLIRRPRRSSCSPGAGTFLFIFRSLSARTTSAGAVPGIAHCSPISAPTTVYVTARHAQFDENVCQAVTGATLSTGLVGSGGAAVPAFTAWRRC